MLRLVEARNFRMLRANRIGLHSFAVLVGQNATGKSTFLGALQLVSDVLKLGGREAEPADAVEQDVKRSLVQAGAAEEHVETIAFVPELEVALGPAWTRTTEELASRRSVSPPSEQDILVHLGGGMLTQELAERPKEVFDALLRSLNLRHSAELFQMLGDRLSIPSLKSGHALERVSKALRRWFSAG